MIKVLLIEDHEMVRDGIERFLEKTSDLRVVGSVGTGKEGIQLAREQHPDVVLLDYELPDTNGLEVTRRLLQYRPEIKILIVTSKNNDILVMKLLEAGALGYFPKEQGFSELERAVRAVERGQRYLSADMANVLALRNVDGDAKTPFDKLSNKEMEVALLISRGLTPEQAAKQLHITKKTVHSYRYRIFEKLRIKTDLALMIMALRYGIVDIEGPPPSEGTA